MQNSFSFGAMDLDCPATKSIESILNSSLASGRPYVHPYLEVSVNRHLEATLLADDERVPEKYSFEKISFPGNIAAQNIMIRIGSYFKFTQTPEPSLVNSKAKPLSLSRILIR
jgi:hypothetical protein